MDKPVYNVMLTAVYVVYLHLHMCCAKNILRLLKSTFDSD